MPKQTAKRKKRTVRYAAGAQDKKPRRIKKPSRLEIPVTQEEPVAGVTAAEHEGLQPYISSQFIPSSADVEADMVEVMEVEVTSGPED